MVSNRGAFQVAGNPSSPSPNEVPQLLDGPHGPGVEQPVRSTTEPPPSGDRGAQRHRRHRSLHQRVQLPVRRHGGRQRARPRAGHAGRAGDPFRPDETPLPGGAHRARSRHDARPGRHGPSPAPSGRTAARPRPRESLVRILVAPAGIRTVTSGRPPIRFPDVLDHVPRSSTPALTPRLARVPDGPGPDPRRPGPVLHDGDVIHASAHGLADLAAAAPLTSEHRFRVASHSKTFTATAVRAARRARPPAPRRHDRPAPRGPGRRADRSGRAARAAGARRRRHP